MRRPKQAAKKRQRNWTVLCLFVVALLSAGAQAQSDCSEGGGTLDMTPPKDLATQALIQKFVAGEDRVQAARSRYQYTQDVLVQTLDDKNAIDGQFHQIAQISYDNSGKRQENVTYSEVSTLRGIALSNEDWDDIRMFMPWVLTAEQAAQYTLTYAGQQHVDDLDTYVFHVVPKNEEKNKRYFEGRVWVDNRDLQVVKLCGKSVPDVVHKKNQPVNVRPTFTSYRQIIDGNWFPVYSRVDDTLHFRAESVHVREIVKYTGYKRADAGK